jgi:hypothetical protein
LYFLITLYQKTLIVRHKSGNKIIKNLFLLYFNLFPKSASKITKADIFTVLATESCIVLHVTYPPFTLCERFEPFYYIYTCTFIQYIFHSFADNYEKWPFDNVDGRFLTWRSTVRKFIFSYITWIIKHFHFKTKHKLFITYIPQDIPLSDFA